MRATPTSLVAGVLALGLSASAFLSSPAQAGDPSSSDAISASAGTSKYAAERDENHRSAYSLRLTTFNILTSSMAGGGVSRAHRAARWVQGQSADVAAFQEVAADQLRQLKHTMVGYSFYPQRSLGSRGSAIQIAWKKSEMQIVKKGYLTRPFLGYQRPIPYVRLIDRATGRDFWVMAIHNAPGTHESERDAATGTEISWIKKMLGTDRPVFAIGDVNERSEFCDKVAHATPLESMNNGSSHRPCPVPRYGGPDWMLGAGATFSGFKKVYNHISDHPALTAHARVPAVG